MGVPQMGSNDFVSKNGGFIMENPIKWMIWGYPHDLGKLQMSQTTDFQG